MSGVWRLLRSLRVRLLGPEKEYVGSDPFGNKYYRVPKHQAAGGGIIQEKRGMEPVVMKKEHEYEAGSIPMEWEAWLRKKRKDPPTIEEVLKNENYKEEMKKRIEEVCEKDRLQQAKEYEEGLVAERLHTQIKGHASALPFGKNEPSEDPVSAANTFQPGSWMPSKESPQKKKESG